MNILRNVTEGVSPLNWGGFKPGEMTVYSAGRGTGKSIYNTNLCKEIMLSVKPESKYKFTRANWYVAEFDWRDYDAVREWCAEQFGPQPQNPDAWSRWYEGPWSRIHFRDDKDYVLFILRWA